MRLHAGLAVSHDSSLLVSLSADKSVKVFDVHTYDMMAMLRLSFVPACAEWIYKVSEQVCVPVALFQLLRWGKGHAEDSL